MADGQVTSTSVELSPPPHTSSGVGAGSCWTLDSVTRPGGTWSLLLSSRGPLRLGLSQGLAPTLCSEMAGAAPGD